MWKPHEEILTDLDAPEAMLQDLGDEASIGHAWNNPRDDRWRIWIISRFFSQEQTYNVLLRILDSTPCEDSIWHTTDCFFTPETMTLLVAASMSSQWLEAERLALRDEAEAIVKKTEPESRQFYFNEAIYYAVCALTYSRWQKADIAEYIALCCLHVVFAGQNNTAWNNPNATKEEEETSYIQREALHAAQADVIRHCYAGRTINNIIERQLAMHNVPLD